MLLAFALTVVGTAGSPETQAKQVQWHPVGDKSEVWIYGPPCPKSTNTEIVMCDWSIPTTPRGVTRFAKDHSLARYNVAYADLNGDDQPEALVYVVSSVSGGSADLCGSGGCDLYVLSLSPTGYRIVSRISVSQLPIRVLPTITKRWHDLSVRVAGGGVTPGYAAQLRFDGRTYPTNPTVPPAKRLAVESGMTAIGTMSPMPR